MNKKLLFVLLLVAVLALSLIVVGCKTKNGKSENGITLCVESDKAVIEAITGYPFWDYYNTPGAQLGYSALLFGNSGCSSYVLEYKSPYPYCWGVYLTESCSTQAVAFLRDNQGGFMKDANNYPFSDFSDDGIIDGKIWYAYQQSDHFSQSDYIVIRASNYEEFKDIPGYKLVLCVIGKELIIHQDLRGNQYERTMPLYCRKVLRYGEHGLEDSDDFLRAQGEQLLFAYEGYYLEVGRSDFVEQSVAYIPQRGIGAYTRTISAQMKLIDDQLLVLLPQYVDYGWGSVDLLSADTNQIDPRDDLFGASREVFSKTLVETCVQSTGNYTLSWFDYDGIRRVLETQTDSSKMIEDYCLAMDYQKADAMDTYELNMQWFFQHLYTYSPMNSHASCGYVSFIQYMLYYDTFYNDTIIPEAYERNAGSQTDVLSAISSSPGVLRHSYITGEVPDSERTLYNYIQANKSTDYQMLLMNLINMALCRSPESYSDSVHMRNYHYILDEIFGLGGYNFTYISVHDFGSAAIPTDDIVISGFDSYVKGLLDEGKPVLLHFAQYNSVTGTYDNYHAVVAYYYDELGIHYHNGYGLYSVDMVLPSNRQITEAGVIDDSYITTHHHSNGYIVKPNLLKRQFNVEERNKVWVTDITYLIWKDKRAYLSTILDLSDRRVVAYKISKFNNNQLVMDTLNEAIVKEKDVDGIILHSDQGFQYTSFEYKAICTANGITISMSRKGTPIDDSPMESFHGILKKETLYNNYITSLEEYIALVEDWIEFYNTKRIKNRKRT